jgi:hypothetical protein
MLPVWDRRDFHVKVGCHIGGLWKTDKKRAGVAQGAALAVRSITAWPTIFERIKRALAARLTLPTLAENARMGHPFVFVVPVGSKAWAIRRPKRFPNCTSTGEKSR